MSAQTIKKYQLIDSIQHEKGSIFLSIPFHWVSSF